MTSEIYKGPAELYYITKEQYIQRFLHGLSHPLTKKERLGLNMIERFLKGICNTKTLCLLCDNILQEKSLEAIMYTLPFPFKPGHSEMSSPVFGICASCADATARDRAIQRLVASTYVENVEKLDALDT